MRSRRSSRHGFTLVELLLVLAILGFALAAVHRAFSQGLRYHDRFQEASQYARSCTHLWESVRNDALNLSATDSVQVGDSGQLRFCRDQREQSDVLYGLAPGSEVLARLLVTESSAAAGTDTVLVEQYPGIGSLEIEVVGQAIDHRKAHVLTASATGEHPPAPPQSVRIWLPVRSALAGEDY